MKITPLTRPRDSHWITLRRMGILFLLSLLAASNMIDGRIPTTLASSHQELSLNVKPAEPKGETFIVTVFKYVQYNYEVVEQKRVGFEEAVRLLKEQITNPPSHRRSSYAVALDYVQLVDVYLSRGQDEEAIATLREGLRRIPKEARLYSKLAEFYGDRGHYEDAVRTLNRAIELEPTLGWLRYELALIYNKKGDHDAAIRALTNVLRPTHPPDVLEAAGISWLGLRENLGKVHHALGLAHSGKADYDEAIRFLKRAIELGGDAHKDLQKVYEAKEKAQTSIRDLTQLASNAEQAGQLRESLKHYTSALQYVAEGSTEARDFKERILRIARSIKPPPALPEEAHQHLVYGVTATKEAKTSADFENAVREFRKALRLAPWWADAYLNLAIAQEGAGKYADAAKSLEFFLLAAPNDPEAKRLRNKIYELEYKAKTAQKK